MLLADDYNTRLFTNKMKYVIDNSIEVKKIGDNGKDTASKLFDYRNYAEPINNFINSITL